MRAKILIALTIVLPVGILAREPISPPPKIATEKQIRARDLGIPFGGTPGKFNAITDVAGVEVGYTTITSGEGKLEVGKFQTVLLLRIASCVPA